MRRTLAALEVSLRIRTTPISAVERTCVPPHSSREKSPSPISTIRTTSPYFSPNSAIAPSARASSSVVVIGRTGWFSTIQALTWSSTSRSSCARQRLAVAEVEAQLVGPDVGAGLAHVAAEPPAQRRVQQMRRRVVALGRVARATRSTRAYDALALVQLALLEDRVQRLVVAEPHDVGDARAAVAVGALDHADVGDLAAAGGVERRVDELDEHAAVALLDRADRRRLLGRLVADEAVAKPAAPANALARSRPASASPSPPSPARLRRALLVHQRVEAGLVDAQPRLGDELARQLDREAERVVQAERVLAAHRRREPSRARSISSRSTRGPARACGRSAPPRRRARRRSRSRCSCSSG